VRRSVLSDNDEKKQSICSGISFAQLEENKRIKNQTYINGENPEIKSISILSSN
jgi:hypothetical protein